MIRGDPFCYVLFTEFGLRSIPLYVLVRAVYGCLLYNYLTVERGVRPLGIEPRQIVILHPPSPDWHDAKIRFEKDWREAGTRPTGDIRRTA